MFRRQNKQQKTSTRDWGDHFSLTLAAQNGMPFMTFSGEVVESLRYMLARLGRQQGIPDRLALIAALRQEGVTYISRALATVMANDLPVTVCVVELNWWWWAAVPAGAPHTAGLAGILRNECTIDDALVHTDRENLSLLPAGRVNLINRPVFARSDRLRETLARLDEQFDYVILDVPALLATSDAIPLASLGDGCCLVMRHGATSIDRIQQALDDVEHLQVIGTVMNQVELATPSWLFKYVPQG